MRYAKTVAMVAVMTTLIICIVYSELLEYKRETNKLEFKKWDIKTCTTADYSVRLNLTTEWYAEFQHHQKANKKDILNVLRKAILKDLHELSPAFEQEKKKDFELQIA